MGADSSFDIVSEVNLQELDNAIVQAQKEIINRFDFRGSAAKVEDFNKKEKEMTVLADNDVQLEAVVTVLISKMIKRGVDAKSLDRQKVEAATHNTVRQKIKLKQGIDRDTAKALQKQIKDLGLKVNASIQGEAIRVSSSKKDDLQSVIAYLKANPPAVPIQFNNYK